MILPKFARFCAFVAIAGLISLPLSARAAITVTVDAGYLRQDATTALNSTTGGGALLLLVASGAANGQTFTATPSAGTYVGGGDVVMAAFGLNTAGGSSGTGKETFNTLNSIAFPTNVVAGAYLELRWYPSITLTQYNGGTTPSAGTIFGAYNPLVTNSSGNTTLNPDGNNLWRLPGDGNTIRLNFYTNEPPNGGTQAVSEGYANFTVPVPEPSAGVLAGLGLVALVSATSHWKKSRTV